MEEELCSECFAVGKEKPAIVNGGFWGWEDMPVDLCISHFERLKTKFKIFKDYRVKPTLETQA